MSTIKMRAEIGTGRGLATALDPWGDGETETEVHFVHCNYRRPDEAEMMHQLLEADRESLMVIERWNLREAA